MPETAVTFQPGPLRGSVRVPGDKSISHRALIAGSRCETPLRIANLNPGRDVLATREALVRLGVSISADARDVVVTGRTLAAPPGTLDCMNSGSTVRMLLGVCAGANVAARFDGDESLRRRPMEPVAAQLRAFGATIETNQGRLPMELLGRTAVQTRHFILLAPSAQVKSALLFAGLFAGAGVQVDGDHGSRDHTERLLQALGAGVEWDGRSVRLEPRPLSGGELEVAGDFSAAAFFITAAAITPGSSVVVVNVGVNPTRTGLLDALRSMGAAIELRNPRTRSGEPIADVAVEYRSLSPIAASADLTLRAIDEIPLLACAAAFAPGTSTIGGTADLRSKESDRIAAIERLLDAVGVASQYERGVLRVSGGAPKGSPRVIQTEGDHRIAMAAATLACAAGPLALDGMQSVDVSFPGFGAALDSLRTA